MSDSQYFVRIQGKVSGPFSLAHLSRLRERGMIHGFHEVSEDRVNWRAASEMQSLFPMTKSARPGNDPDVLQVERVERDDNARTAPKAEATWFYVNDDGKRVGPMPEVEILALLARGEIAPATQVWKRGMADWTTLSTTGLVPKPKEETETAADATDRLSLLGSFAVNPIDNLATFCSRCGWQTALVLGLLGVLVNDMLFVTGGVLVIRRGMEWRDLNPIFQRMDAQVINHEVVTRLVVLGFCPTVFLCAALTLIRLVTRSTGHICFDVLVAAISTAPLAVYSFLVPLLPRLPEVLLVALLLSVVFSILVLNACITKVFERGAWASVAGIPFCWTIVVYLTSVVLRFLV